MSRPHRGSFVAALALLVLAGPVVEARGDAGESDVFVGMDLVDFGYREFDTDGRELNHEYGLLPGLRLTARAARDRLFARLDASLHDGNVDYDGETQGGAPIRSTTETRVLSFSAEVGRWVNAGTGRRWAAYLRLASRTWDRDIQGTGNVQGLFEEYRWNELGVGLRYVFPGEGAGGWQQEVSGSVVAIASGDIFVELSGIERVGDRPRFDDTSLELGDAGGLRLRYTASRPLAEGRRFRIEPYVAYWEFGRSTTRTVTADGAATNLRVTEPESESTRIGVAFGVVF